MRAYRRTRLRRLVNAIATAAIRVGLPPRHRFLLTVPGRRTGAPRTTPIGLVERDGERYLVAPYGEVAWVRNGRRAGEVTLTRGSESRRYRLHEVSADAAAPVLREYLALEPITRPYFQAEPGDMPAAFAADAAEHPVFRLMSLD